MIVTNHSDVRACPWEPDELLREMRWWIGFHGDTLPPPPITEAMVLDALERRVVQTLAVAAADPAQLGAALRAFDAIVGVRDLLGLVPSDAIDLNPTACDVANEVFALIQVVTENRRLPRWAGQLAQPFVTTANRSDVGGHGADRGEAIRGAGGMARICRGLELGAIESLVEGDAANGLHGLRAVATLRARCGWSRAQELALLDAAPPPTVSVRGAATGS